MHMSRVFVTKYDDNLTHWGQEEMDAILQLRFSNEFSWMKMY